VGEGDVELARANRARQRPALPAQAPTRRHRSAARGGSPGAACNDSVTSGDLLNTLGTLPDALITRCAWCGRYGVGGQWLPKEDVAAFLRDDGSTVTHGICPDCVEDLRLRQLSA
jgi:hypothetical protein